MLDVETELLRLGDIASQRCGDGFKGLGGHSEIQEAPEVIYRAHGNSASYP